MSEIVNNKLVFTHTKNGAKYLLKVKPLRADGVATTFSNYIEKTAGDSSYIDIDLLVDVSSNDNGVTFTITNDLPSHITKFEWIVKTTLDAGVARNSTTGSPIVTGDNIYDGTTIFYDSASSQAGNEILGAAGLGIVSLGMVDLNGARQLEEKERFVVNDEIMMVGSMTAAGGGNYWVISRGVGNSSTTYHPQGSTVKIFTPPALLDIPTQTTSEPQFTYSSAANETLFVWVRVVNKFGVPSLWQEQDLIITPQTQAMSELEGQLGMNLVQNWSFENGDGTDAAMWDHALEASVQTSLSIGYNGTDISNFDTANLYLDAGQTDFQGDYYGAAGGPWTGSTYTAPTVELVDGDLTTSYLDYSKLYTKSSASILKHIGIDQYVFKAVIGVAGYGNWASATHAKRVEPWTHHTYRPRVQIIVYQYDFDGVFLDTLTSDEKECSGTQTYLTWDDGAVPIPATGSRAMVLPVDVDFTFSGFHANCSTFRIGFAILAKDEDNWRDLTNDPTGGVGGLTQGQYRVIFDAVSMTAGSVLGGYSPFVLTEDTPAADIAETYLVSGELNKGGCIVTFGDTINGKPTVRLAKSDDKDGPLLCVSSNYFFTLKDKDNREPGVKTISIALTGRVRCRVHGPISINDPVTIMDLGVGKKCDDSSSILGYALDNIGTTEIKEILVFIK